jgi:hypothetical protein
MLETIAATVLAAALIAGGGWLIRAIFLVRPRVRLAYAQGIGASGVGTSDQLTITWGFSFTLTNLTKYDALNLETVHNSNGIFPRLTTPHLKALESITLRHSKSRLVTRDTVVRTRHDFHGELLPPDLREIVVCLRYQNETGFPLYFYTLYQKTSDHEQNTYYLHRPKLVAAAEVSR